MLKLIEHLIDSLTPGAPDYDPHLRKRIRMFLISHLFGPLLGLPIPIALGFFDPQPYPHVLLLTLSILAFWVFPLLVHFLPVRFFTALALISITNLNFAILWGAYNYGGVSSPFLMWYMLLPLLGFFYLGGGRRARLYIFGQILLGLGAFTVAAYVGGLRFPERVPLENMVVAGLLSAFCSTAYIFFMAAYYAQVVDSQSELVKEITRHQSTLKKLTVSRDEAEQAKFLVEARNVELEAARKRLEYTALHDALTGLPNRRYLDERLAKDGDWCRQNGGSLALLHIDLDRFKQINDTLGHGAGDMMLIHAANLLQTSLRNDDFLARYGGDEFVIVKRNKTDMQRLTLMAEHLIGLMSQPVPYENHFCRFGASIGIAVENGANVDTKRLLIDSDIALYRAKNGGRNRVEFFTKELQLQIVNAKRIADDILRGLEQGEFLAHYQPQFDAKTFQLVGVEALARWNHPTQGLLQPAAFMAIAEDLNVIAQIDRLMLEKALAEFQRWSAANLKIPRISVNVSSKRLNDKELIYSLKGLKFRPGTLAFELVESIFLDEIDETVENNITQLKELGIDIEIDDFGTGHASIVSLLKLSPKRLKIDRQFITPLLESPEHSKLVGSIIEIGKSLGIEVIAEGVESMDQAYHLRDLGCDTVQGYAFASPMPGMELGGFLMEEPWRLVS